MVEYHDYTQEKLAFAISKAKSTISETISINRLPEAIKEKVRLAERYSRRLLVEIAKQETNEAMINLFNLVKEGNIKSDAVRNISRKKAEKAPSRTPAEITRERAHALNNFLDKVNYKEIGPEEKESLITELQNLKDKIDNLFILFSS